MHCPKCDTSNRTGAKFCRTCGATISWLCARCRTELVPGSAFCHACGAQVQASHITRQDLGRAIERLVPKQYADRLLATRGQVPHERRTVTILFSDVQGSTAMAETLDPEDVLDIMEGAFDLLIAPITRYEGTLARLMGDAVLAFFGAPIAHEDDPERACRAALEILAGARAYASRLEQERGIHGFSVRAGIHTGLVVVGEVGSDLRVEYTAMGDAINLAARLEQAAQPGTVLVSEATQRLVAPLFDVEPLGPIPVKGKAQPQPVYRVLATRTGAGKRRGIPGLESPLVGRQSEFADLRDALARLAGGSGGVVTLSGQAGIGKSRLVAELRKQVGVHGTAPSTTPSPVGAPGVRLVEGRCLSYGSSIAYLLWLDVLRGLLGATLEDTPADVGKALQARLRGLCPDRFGEAYPFLARLLSLPQEDGVSKRLDDLEGREIRDRTFAAVQTLLSCAVREQPTIVVCEDLHWADSTSLELLGYLLPLARTRPLLFLCVSRPVRDAHVLELWETISTEVADLHTNLPLQPLSDEEGQSLISNLLRLGDLPLELGNRILDRAEGNPFYLEEVLRSLIDQGSIAQDPASGCWRAVQDVMAIAIPDTLEGVLVARIDRLQEETRRVLQLASVIGRIFFYRTLADIAAAEAAAYRMLTLDHRLATLQHEDLIRERARAPELEYIFKHDLTREAAYNGLLKRDRRVYHRRVAESLERLFPDRIGEMLGLLAHHWEQARVTGKAVDYLSRAGDQARLAHSHVEAVDAYERVLALLEPEQDHEGMLRTLMKLGLTHTTSFDYEAAQRAYQEAFALRQQEEQKPVAAHLPAAPHAFRIAVNPVGAIDPAGRPQSLLISSVFSGLVEVSSGGNVVPDAAQSWELLDGGRRYIFYLRPDASWSDGAPVTAGDFVYAWKRILHPTTRAELANSLHDIKNGKDYHAGRLTDPACLGIRALDDHTLQVELVEPSAYFLYLLAYSATYPVPRHRVETLGKDWARAGSLVGNGPFLVDDWQPGKSVALVRNPDYRGHFGGNLQEANLVQRSDPREDLALYEQDKLDILDLWQVPLRERDRARQRHAGEYRTGPLPLAFYAGFNTRRAPFDDVRVRRAFALVIDRARLLEASLKTYSVPGTGGLVPPGMPGHSDGISLPHDREQARRLLAEAGFPNGRGFPTVEVLSWLSDTNDVDKTLRDEWREGLGIRIDWRTIALEQWDEQWRNDPPHIFENSWWADYPDPDSFLRGALSWSNLGHREPEFDRLVATARRVTDQAERLRLYRQADSLLIDKARIILIEYGQSHTLLKPWVSKAPVSPMAWTRLNGIVIEPH